jgi:outer membrane protein assembly factor BamB
MAAAADGRWSNRLTRSQRRRWTAAVAAGSGLNEIGNFLVFLRTETMNQHALPLRLIYRFALAWAALAAGFLALGAGLLTPPALAGDWPSWRGPEQTGVSRERDLPDKFSLDPKDEKSNLLWTAPYSCRSTPLVLNGRVYLISHVGEGLREQERVVCLDAGTGKKLWEHRFNVFFTDIVSVRLGWTSPAGDPETGNIYAHGTQGLFFCFDKDGKILWKHSLTEEYGRISGYGGRVTSPTVDGDLVIIGMLNASWGDQGRGGNRWLAMDKRTGKPVWWSAPADLPRDTYYSVPVVAVIGGQRLLISGGADGAVHAMKVRTGEKVWSYKFGTGAVNCSPVVHGNLIYIGHGEENPDNNIQGRFICIDGSKVKDGKPQLVWKKDGLKAKYPSPVIHEGRVYIADDGAKLYCLDATKGDYLWKRPFRYGRNAKGSPVWADGKLYVADVNSHFHILKPGKKRCQELHDQFFPGSEEGLDVELNGSPAVANGRVYFGTSDAMYCIGKKDHKTRADKIPDPVNKEEEADSKAEPAHLQIVPADVVLSPGKSVKFTVRAFDDHGRFLKVVTTKSKWSLPAPPPPPNSKLKPPKLKGKISKGKLTVDKPVPAQQGLVQAKVGDLTGLARVRVAPVLPYRQDFQKVPVGAPVGGWVNCAGKFVVEEKDGMKVLKKTNVLPSPLVARARTFITLPQKDDYTITADVMGSQKKQDLPDMGVVAKRYTLMLAGNTQQLRLVSWNALPRVDKTIQFPWKPKVWYRLKLRVDVNGKTALVRGKVWEKDEAEPKGWTVEVEDPVPNPEGSPALYGNSTAILPDSPGTEAFFANVTVTPNGKD